MCLQFRCEENGDHGAGDLVWVFWFCMMWMETKAAFHEECVNGSYKAIVLSLLDHTHPAFYHFKCHKSSNKYDF